MTVGNILLPVCLLGALLAGTARAGDIHLLVDTAAATLTVMEEGTEVRTFEDIAIGRFGTTRYKKRGDNRTPLVTYRIGWITDESRYHRFLGINFPDLRTASRAVFDGTIGMQQWEQIRRDVDNGKTPSQQTPLGGYLGIHGIGAGDPEVHRQFNWTNGCIALTNEQIDDLIQWVRVGTVVEIR